jgi:enediyne biosynthesis protein E4
MRVWCTGALAIAALTTACGSGPRADSEAADSSASTSASSEWFTDRTTEAGISFVHFNGMSGAYYFPEVMPPGVGLFDYDNDGDLDLFLVQGRMLGTGTPLRPPSNPVKSRLLRNDLHVAANGTSTVRFVDVTEHAGITADGYGMGVAAGDIDNDGWTDLYVTNFGRNQMLRNNRDGTFTDISTRSGTNHDGFSVSAAFVDYDRDGWLDLYVGNYVVYQIANDQRCSNLAGVRTYCPPQVYRAQPDRLYRNRGDGTFADMTAQALVGPDFGRALGVATADFDGDGWIDIYVANDGTENILWTNQRNGTFRNTALLAGVALTAEGQAEASMGVDAGDFDNDGDEDLFMTELNGEGSNLYVNAGNGFFDDRGARSAVGPLSLQYTGFGAAWIDFDNDGWLDLLSVNGRIQAAEGDTRGPFPLEQPPLLFRSLGNGRFEDVSAAAGPAFRMPHVGRGAAFGDIDNDGDQDVVIGNDAGPTRLLINNVGNRNHWVGLRLVGQRTSRDMVGARVELTRNDGSVLARRARSDGSYASANDPRVLVGLGTTGGPSRVRVRWPNGQMDEWSDVPADRWTTLVEGSAR